MATITTNHGATKAAGRRAFPHLVLPLGSRLVRMSAVAGVLLTLWATLGPRLSESGVWQAFAAIVGVLWTVAMAAVALLVLWGVYIVSIFVH
jgi:hypothetical protein